MKVFLDHYQAEQFGLYWRHYPQIALNAGLLYNMLLYDDIALQSDALYPDECREAKWGGAFEHFLKLGKIQLIDDRDSMERSASAVFSGSLDGLNVPDFEDVLNYDYCVRNGTPFCISKRRSHDILRIAGLAREALHTPTQGDPISNAKAPDNKAAIAHWLVELEIPALIARSERMRHKVFHDMPHLEAHRGDGTVDGDFTTLLAASKWYELQGSLFLAPDELVLMFDARQQMRELAQVLRGLAGRVSSRAELVDEVRAIREQLDTRLGNSDFMFAGINVGLCWVPFSGLVTTPSQIAVNRYIKGYFNWLLFLTSLNKQVRRTKGMDT